MPQLTTEQREFFDGDITKTEIQEAIASLESCKSPGPDGLPAEFDKKYSEPRAPQLKTVFARAKEL